jgi:opacity protein-like surface antigen
MQKFILLFAFLIVSFKAFGFEYRHKNAKRPTQGQYYYISAGLVLPFTNKIDDVSKLNSGILQIEPFANAFAPTSGEMNFPAKKIGGMASIGYKFTYIIRVDLKIDYTTYSKNYTFPPNTDYSGRSVENGDFTVRQIGFIPTIYLDLDNTSSFTPYVGFGYGLAYTSAIGVLNSNKNSNNNNSVNIEGGSFKMHPAYELKAGFKFGNKVAYLDIEAFIRKTQSLNLESRGFILKIVFPI